MTKYEILKNDMIKALKEKDKFKRLTLADMIAAIDKAATSGKARVEITEELVNSTLLKYQKTVQEMIDTCPEGEKYANKKQEYLNKLEIVLQYVPILISNEDEIKKMIISILGEIFDFKKENKGMIMKKVMPTLKGKVDMSVANRVIGTLLK